MSCARIHGREIFFGFMLALGVVALILALATSTVPIVEICEKCAAPSNQNKCSAYGVFGFFGWVLQTYNGALQAIFAGFVAAFTWSLVRLAREQVAISKRLNRAELLIESAHLQMRDGFRPNLTIVVRNFGGSTATDVRCKWQWKLYPRNNGTFDLSRIDEMKKPNLPKGQILRLAKIPAESEWGEPNQLLKRADINLYYFGEITYRDAFLADAAPPRKTTFRIESMIDDSGHANAIFIPCEEGNEST